MKIILKICILSLASSLTAQNIQKEKYIDSLIKAVELMPEDTLKVQNYATLFEQLQFSNLDLAKNYNKKALDLSKKLAYQEGIAVSHFHFADYYKFKGNIDSARFNFEKAGRLGKKIKSLRLELFINHSRADFEKSLGNYEEALVYAYRNIDIYKERDTTNSDLNRSFSLIGSEYELVGGIHQEMGNYKIALSESLKALKFFEEKKDTVRKGDALMQIGTIESQLNNLDSAIEHVKEAYDIYDSYNDKQYKAYAANNIGEFYLEQRLPSETLFYLNEGLKISKEIGNKEIEANSLASLGSAHLQLKEYPKAKNYLQQAYEIYRNLGYKKSISMNLNQLASVSIQTKNEEEAIEFLEQSLDIAKSIGAKDNISDAYQLLSLAYKSKRDYQKSLLNYEAYKTINDSIFNKTKSQQIEELRAIYDTEKKEQQIALQENEISLLGQKEKNSRLQKILMGVGLLLSVIAYYALRQKMKRNKLEKEKLDAELAFKKKELTTHALHLAKKNETLESLKQKAEELKLKADGKQGYTQLIRTINFDLQDDNNWENFSRYFEEVHKDFNSNVKTKYPQITSNELRLLALLKMNLSSKEIANILNISPEGIKKARYRLRKKLDIATENSLQDLVLSL